MNEKLANWRWALGGLFLSGALGVGIFGLASGDVWADREHGDDDHEAYEHDEDDRYGRTGGSPGSPVAALYREECGSCHVAYPAGLLPAASWQALMTGLDDHFGDNAELLEQDRQQIEAYLVADAADRSRYGNRRYAAGVDASQPPLRITELRYFINEHDEIPDRLLGDNSQVRSFSQCDQCHAGAAEGSFDEDRVSIPGYGHWED